MFYTLTAPQCSLTSKLLMLTKTAPLNTCRACIPTTQYLKQQPPHVVMYCMPLPARWPNASYNTQGLIKILLTSHGSLLPIAIFRAKIISPMQMTLLKENFKILTSEKGW